MSDHQWNQNIKLYPTDRLFKVVFARLFPASVRPNHLTVLRLLLISPVLYYLSTEQYAVGVPLFFFAALTDWFDGALARTRKQVTEWGILYDPLVDKLLIGLVLFIIVLRHVNFALGVALLLIEATIIVAAWLRKRNGLVAQADIWGKSKMVAEVTGIMLVLIAQWVNVDLFVHLSNGTLALALALAILSIFSRMV